MLRVGLSGIFRIGRNEGLNFTRGCSRIVRALKGEEVERYEV